MPHLLNVTKNLGSSGFRVGGGIGFQPFAIRKAVLNSVRPEPVEGPKDLFSAPFILRHAQDERS